MKIYILVISLLVCMTIQSGEMTQQELSLLHQDPLKCNQRILQHYGFVGMDSAIVPPPEEQDGGQNYCMGMEHTCCERDDFLKSNMLWDQNAQKIKGYLTKLFRIIQKVVLMQDSFIRVAENITMMNPDNKYCQTVDTTFFNPPVPFDQIYTYIKTAFQAMAYIQKGFYCMLCDVRNHKFMSFEQSYSRLMIAMSKKSCSDLAFYFKEYMMYKVYYLDPFMQNIYKLMNCYYETDSYAYNPEYPFRYPHVKTCVEGDEGPAKDAACEFVCLDFKFGASSKLFMGDLQAYEKFLYDLTEFGKEHDIDMESPASQLYIPEYTYVDNQFFKSEKKFTSMDKYELNYSNVSKMQVVVFNHGIDIFGTAESANYFLTDQTSTIEKTRIYNINSINDDNASVLQTEAKKQSTLSPEDIEKQMQDEEKELEQARLHEQLIKLKKLNADEIPTSIEMENLDDNIEEQEKILRDKDRKTQKISDHIKINERFNDFGNVGLDNSIKILQMYLVLLFSLSSIIKF